MRELETILLVEDDANDVELTLRALGELNLANEVDVTRDGAEALDYLRREGSFAGRGGGNPVVILLDLKMPRVEAVRRVGVFWALVNEPPPRVASDGAQDG